MGTTSPPQTPTSASPLFNRNLSPRSRHLPPYQNLARPTSHKSNIQPVGNGPHFSYTRPLRPQQLSPRSSSSSADESDGEEDDEDKEDDEEDDDDEDDDDDEEEDDEDDDNEVEDDDGMSLNSSSPPRSSSPYLSGREVPAVEHGKRRATPIVKANFIIEEMSDVDPMESDDDERILPDGIEYADSNRSRSRSRNPPELDSGMVTDMQNLNCSNESDEYEPDDDHREFILKQRELKMRKRRSHGSSIGKRTHSERSDSDRDEILIQRRRVGDRRSLQFQDPPPEMIEELEEPDSGAEDLLPGETLRELPYYDIEIMEMDSP
jgi:hypothetical protein